MKVAIMTDSNSGITQNEARKLGIRVIPMPFMIEGEEYYEDINLTQEQFYKLIENDANVCTSQPSIGLVTSIWDELLKEYDQVVYIPMSSGLSMSCATARQMALAHYKDKVFVVDNHRISVTQKRSVFDAMRLANLGYDGRQIEEILLKNMHNSSIYILVDTLKYLCKGGRCSKGVYLLGTILKVKPILQIHGEKLDTFKKTRTLENAKRIMIEQVKEDIKNFLSFDGRTDNIHIDVAYTKNEQEALKFAEEIKAEFKVDDVLVNPLSLSVSCHIGPGALAIGATKDTIIE